MALPCILDIDAKWFLRKVFSMSSFDKRELERFSLEIPGFVQAANGQLGEPIEVVTKDVCAGGALFHSKELMDVGTPVDVELVIPIQELKHLEGDKVLVRVAGAIVRAERNGIAVRFDQNYKMTPFTQN